mgnify:CR=1 FL=1
MLQQLKLFNVGPANSWVLNPLAERLNLITGDNGLGKSFLLDVAWWALSRKWPYDLNAKLTSGYAARPSDVKQPAKICFENPVRSRYESTYIAREQSWQGPAGRPLHSGLVIYARADGSFAVWDSARNYWRKQGKNDVQDTVPAYVFSSQELWYGLDVMRGDKQVRACNGLVTDVISWVHGKGEDAERIGFGRQTKARTPTGAGGQAKARTSTVMKRGSALRALGLSFGLWPRRGWPSLPSCGGGCGGVVLRCTAW